MAVIKMGCEIIFMNGRVFSFSLFSYMLMLGAGCKVSKTKKKHALINVNNKKQPAKSMVSISIDFLAM